MRGRLTLAALAVCTAAPAAAFNYCHEAWFTRNLIFDRAGYCFGSVLGQHVFDNGDCTTKSPALSAADKAIVADLKGEEAHVGCKVNTSTARDLEIPDIAFRKKLTPAPVPDHIGFGCMGWRGADVPLFAAPSGQDAEVGRVTTGDNVLVFHFPAKAGTFLTINRQGTEFQGWSNTIQMNAATCTHMAG